MTTAWTAELVSMSNVLDIHSSSVSADDQPNVHELVSA